MNIRKQMKYTNLLFCCILFLWLPNASPLTLMAGEAIFGDDYPVKQDNYNSKNKAKWWNKRGNFYFSRKNFAKAVQCYREAIALAPAQSICFINLARVYIWDGKGDIAQKLLNEASTKFPQKRDQALLADVHFQWAQRLEKKSDFVNAIIHYKEAYKIDKVYRPELSALDLNKMAVTYSKRGKNHEALTYLKAALPIVQRLKSLPGEAETRGNLGAVYALLGKNQEALKHLEKALSILQKIPFPILKAQTLISLGGVYANLGNMQKAFEHFGNALHIQVKIRDFKLQATTHSNMGAAYESFNLELKALEHYEKAIPLHRRVGDRKGEAITLSQMGMVYHGLGRIGKALECYNNAISLRRAIGDQEGEATELANIAAVYYDSGQLQKALEYYTNALDIDGDVGAPAEKATIHNGMGNSYSELGQKKKALEHYKIALDIFQAVRNREREAVVLNNIGVVYSNLGLMKKALEKFEKALAISREMGNQNTEAKSLGNMANVHLKNTRVDIALEFYLEMLHIAQEAGNRNLEGSAFSCIGAVYLILDRKNEALDILEKALAVLLEVGNKPAEALTLGWMMNAQESMKNRKLAIFYGKLSINIIQNLRNNNSAIEKKFRQSYLESKKDGYRKLANILINEGRLSEAQQILDALKEDEYFRFIRKDSSGNFFRYSLLDFTKFEKKWSQKHTTVINRLSSERKKYHLLKLKQIKTNAEKVQLKKLESQLSKSQKAYDDFLIQMKEAFTQYGNNKIAVKKDVAAMRKEIPALQSTLKFLDKTEGDKHAALHYLVNNSRISIILTTPLSQVVKNTAINEKDFNLLIIQYRNLIMKLGEIKRGTTPIQTTNDRYGKLFQHKKEYEKRLYNTIFKPVDQELKKYGATNLTVSLDGVLRYIPLAALWDGKHYLVQRYRMALITPSFMKHIRDIPLNYKKILGFGAGQGGPGFPTLQFVGREIRAIVRDEKRGYYGLINGKGFLDRAFTRDTMLSQLKTKQYPLVHISSHFKFSPGDESKNQLLLGDGTVMKLSDIRRQGKIFDKVQLLVLSACQTGVGGNGEEIDGFGELAQQGGAKSVIASLWPVADESTKELMVNFYSIMKVGKVTSKIEALRQAQLKLAGLEDLLDKRKKNPGKKTIYASSYFWGPFIMMGNWR